MIQFFTLPRTVIIIKHALWCPVQRIIIKHAPFEKKCFMVTCKKRLRGLGGPREA